MSANQGAMLAGGCSLQVSVQPSWWAVTEGKTSPVGALGWEMEREMLEQGIVSVCLGRTIHCTCSISLPVAACASATCPPSQSF